MKIIVLKTLGSQEKDQKSSSMLQFLHGLALAGLLASFPISSSAFPGPHLFLLVANSYHLSSQHKQHSPDSAKPPCYVPYGSLNLTFHISLVFDSVI